MHQAGSIFSRESILLESLDLRSSRKQGREKPVLYLHRRNVRARKPSPTTARQVGSNALQAIGPVEMAQRLNPRPVAGTKHQAPGTTPSTASTKPMPNTKPVPVASAASSAPEQQRSQPAAQCRRRGAPASCCCLLPPPPQEFYCSSSELVRAIDTTCGY